MTRKRTLSPSLFTTLTILCGLLLTGSSNGCRHEESSPTAPGGSGSPTAGASAGADSPRFVEVAEKSGINYQWTAPGKRPLNILQTIGDGCAFLDYDGDGNLDILLVGGGIPGPDGKTVTPAKLVLYRGDGKGNFTNVSHDTGLDKFSGYYLGCAVGDYDNDGHPDIYISGYREALLLHNEGGKTFTNTAPALGLKPQPWGTSAGWADVDGDGFLDLYVCNYADFGPNTNPQLCKFTTKEHGDLLSSCGPRYYKGIHGVLFHNKGGKGFEDVTTAWGMDAQSGRGLGVAFADYDDSGQPSVAIANDEAPGDLFQNKGAKAKKRFENIGEVSGVSRDRDGNLHGGMGIDWGDYNNDGKLDLFVATFRNEAKNLYRNDGGGLFTDVSYPAGIGQPALPFVTFGCKFLDADNDGWLDLLIANGHVQDNIKLIENTDYPQKTMFLRNVNGTFSDMTDTSGIGALPPIVGRGLAVGDYDNDGKMDALIVDSEGKPLLLHNETAKPGNWIGFRVVEKSGRDAYGAILTVETASGKKYVRQCQAAGSYMSSNDPRVHFGLGAESTVTKLTVHWPNGKTENWEAIPTGHYLVVQPGSAPR